MANVALQSIHLLLVEVPFAEVFLNGRSELLLSIFLLP